MSFKDGWVFPDKIFLHCFSFCYPVIWLHLVSGYDSKNQNIFFGIRGRISKSRLFYLYRSETNMDLQQFSPSGKWFWSHLVYSNIFYVLKTRKNQLIPEKIWRSGSCILWSIWKNRNSFIFEGNLALGQSFIRAIYDEVDHWFLIKSKE